VVDIDTRRGLARAHLHPVEEPKAAMVLGHGAAGSVGAPDLVAATAAAHAAGLSVALVEQPYRVAGRRSAAPAAHLDEAWVDVVAELAGGPLAGLPLITGGRSSGARVACRTAAETGARGVLCLAFPLKPPRSDKDRQDELDAVEVPVLIVQGESDQFGRPEPGERREVVLIRGNHGLKADHAALREAVTAWLGRTLGLRR
jgi:predicted alpha/beta-hydrolase family hydrolase